MSTRPAEILVVDDEPAICSMLVEALKGPARQCAAANSACEALALLCDHPFDLIVSDVSMPEMTGLELMTQARAIRPDCQTILISGVGTPTIAKQAIRQGAFDYIEKPFDLEELRDVVDSAVAAGSGGVNATVSSDEDNGAGMRDPLTGLWNHRRFVEELGALRARCRRSNQPLSVLIVDINQFRLVNERYGHIRGDLLLREVGKRLKSSSRDGDVVARYAWDQFAIALPDTPGEAAQVVAARCLGAVSQPIGCGGQPVHCVISIGLAECESGFIENETDLLRRAGEALAEAKNRGGNVVVSWSELAERHCQGPRPDLPGVEAMRREFHRVQAQLKQSYLESTRALVAAVEAKDPYTEKHSLTVSHYAASFARHMGLPAAMIDAIATAGILHDVGKIGIPDSILTKPGRLTDDELALVKRHPVMGIHILEHISFLRAELPIILHHHEWYDGRGYPEGLAGERIPLGARILHLADTLDAMLSVRSYKGSYPLAFAISELRRCSGGQFDPKLAERAIEWIESHPEQIVYPHERHRILPRICEMHARSASVV
jgi:diguanylate cyclase (GGDEF)-like protein